MTAVFTRAGSVSGTSGCNNYVGPYTSSATTLTFGTLSLTQKVCTDFAITQQESAYLAALAKSQTYTIKGDELQLRGADGSLLVSYRAS